MPNIERITEKVDDTTKLLQDYCGVYFPDTYAGTRGSQVYSVGTLWEGIGDLDFASITLSSSPGDKCLATWTISHGDTRISISLTPEEQINFQSWGQPISGNEVSSRLQRFNLPDDASDLLYLLHNPQEMAVAILDSVKKLGS